jgi:hypothetical protein
MMEDIEKDCFVFMSEDAKKQWDKASDAQKHLASVILKRNILDMQLKIEKEMNGQE